MRRVLREWTSPNVQVVLMAAPAGFVMRRETCPDDQYWLLLQGAWRERVGSVTTERSAEGVHYRPATPCVREALADTLSVGVRLFWNAPLRKEGEGARPRDYPRLLWPIARAVLAGETFREDFLDEVAASFLDAQPREGEARAPRWLVQVRERLHDEESPTPLATLAHTAAVTPNHLSATFARCYGRSVSQYRRELALARAVRSLGAGGESLGGAALNGGFYDQAHFTRACRRNLGLTPGQIARLLRRTP